ncbi:unnamed protein product [Onchocerca flexuosa]|uniref:Uncharacterized protein n=1 Tax=Onchocerca flexuosa TaxID=387005 RepID=A0A183HUH9_9BILA|nr:unnamed protein product [Onchocerca flexuosa]
MERDSRPSRRRALTLRKGPENREMLIQMKAFCTTTVATGVQANITHLFFLSFFLDQNSILMAPCVSVKNSC